MIPDNMGLYGIRKRWIATQDKVRLGLVQSSKRATFYIVMTICLYYVNLCKLKYEWFSYCRYHFDRM